MIQKNHFFQEQALLHFWKSSLKVLENGSYDYDNATKVLIGSNGETTLFTDDKGHLVTQPIPYGTYIVLETVTPHNMETIKPFEVKIVENHQQSHRHGVYSWIEFSQLVW